MEVAPGEFPLHPPSPQVAAASARLRRAMRVEADGIKSRRWRRWSPVIAAGLLLWLRGRIAQVGRPQASSRTPSRSAVVRRVHAQAISSSASRFRRNKSNIAATSTKCNCHLQEFLLNDEDLIGQMWSSVTPPSDGWRDKSAF